MSQTYERIMVAIDGSHGSELAFHKGLMSPCVMVLP